MKIKPLITFWAFVYSVSAYAAPYKIADGACFCVVTLKAGVAKAFAHNHLVIAENPKVALDINELQPQRSTFEFSAETKNLVIDSPQAQAKWFPKLKEAKIIDEAFTSASEGDRKKIREAMLSKEQLNADNFTNIKAKLTKVEPSKPFGKFNSELTLEFSIVGKTITKVVPAIITQSNKKIAVESVGKLQFSEFGIEPFSAMLGAVKVQNDFFVYVNFEATKAE